MKKRPLFLCVVFCLTLAAAPGIPLFAADQAADDVVAMIVTLVNDKDKDIRAVGLQQVREQAKGPAATKQFAALLPKLAPDAQTGLLDALADRGDRAARPAVLEMLKSSDPAVRTAALRALGSLGETADVALLVQTLAANAGPEKAAARTALTRLQGTTVVAAIVTESQRARPEIRVDLIGLLAFRRALESVPSLLAASKGADATVRMAAMAALGQLAAPEQMPDMLQGVLKAKKGPEREAAEKAVLLVGSRIEDPDKRAAPLLPAWAKLSDAQQTALLTTLGRLGGSDALKVVEAALGDSHPQRREAGFRALCNWPDVSVAARLQDLATTGSDAEHRTAALRALIRVAALPDNRSAAERLALLRKAMTMATRDEERILVLKRARAIRTIESLRFVVPYLDQPVFAQEACATVVELAHHKKLRQPNKAEFDPVLDKVISTSKNPDLIDKAKRYKQNKV